LEIPLLSEKTAELMVEVAGIEPASESLQQTEPTSVSDSFDFADAAIEPARSMRR